MGPRANLVLTLLAATATLIVAILIGNEMGNHVLGSAIERGPAIGATPVVPPQDLQTNAPPGANWRHEQAVSIATDPAFPDPRITPPPPPTPAPQPTFVATAVPIRTPAPPVPTATPTPLKSKYTSPPLPIPLVTHATREPSSEPTPAGGDVPPPPAETP